jgi:hypothetical protein
MTLSLLKVTLCVLVDIVLANIILFLEGICPFGYLNTHIHTHTHTHTHTHHRGKCKEREMEKERRERHRHRNRQMKREDIFRANQNYTLICTTQTWR